ncbi:MAG: serine/threonine protein phosphatase [Rhodospirillales bacterium]|nr:serine/threonine protein phosphatase [Rhodospirillales bacterium]
MLGNGHERIYGNRKSRAGVFTLTGIIPPHPDHPLPGRRRGHPLPQGERGFLPSPPAGEGGERSEPGEGAAGTCSNYLPLPLGAGGGLGQVSFRHEAAVRIPVVGLAPSLITQHKYKDKSHRKKDNSGELGCISFAFQAASVSRPISHPLADRYRPPADTVLYAVGDIHGRSDLLDRLHAAIVRDSVQYGAKRRLIVYLGDYIDRGADSAGVVARLEGAGPDGFERRFLLGNHDSFLLDFMDGDDAVAETWLGNGGAAALESYGVASDSRRSPTDLRADLARAIPPAHLAFFRALQLTHREGDILFVHAGLRPGVPIPNQARGDMLWIRDTFLESDADFGALVIHGHTPVPEPTIRANRIGVDTGAWRSGTLTAAVIAGDTVSFLQT